MAPVPPKLRQGCELQRVFACDERNTGRLYLIWLWLFDYKLFSALFGQLSIPENKEKVIFYELFDQEHSCKRYWLWSKMSNLCPPFTTACFFYHHMLDSIVTASNKKNREQRRPQGWACPPPPPGRQSYYCLFPWYSDWSLQLLQAGDTAVKRDNITPKFVHLRCSPILQPIMIIQRSLITSANFSSFTIRVMLRLML